MAALMRSSPNSEERPLRPAEVMRANDGKSGVLGCLALTGNSKSACSRSQWIGTVTFFTPGWWAFFFGR